MQRLRPDGAQLGEQVCRGTPGPVGKLPPGAAMVVEDGRILAAVNEERLCRLKLVVGFPRASLREALIKMGIPWQDFDE